MTAQSFDNRVAQLAMAGFGGLFVVLGLAGLAASSGTAVIYLLFGVFTIARGLRSSSVIVDELGVTTRSMVRTRRYRYSELRGVEVAVGPTGFASSSREHLVFQRVDGQDVAFKELNCTPKHSPEATSIVRCAAVCIGERLRGDQLRSS